MHLRKQKTKDGRIYLSIVQGYYVDGKSRSKSIKSLGYVDVLEKDYPDPIAHFQAEVERMNAQAKANNAPIEVTFYPSKKIDKRACHTLELGACVPGAYFYKDLGIWDFFEKKRTARKFNYDPCRILELLVWNRIAHPSSKKGAWEAKEKFPRKCDFSLDDIYRCLTYLNDNADALVEHINKAYESMRGPRNKSLFYYDVTNYYFEIENDDDFRRHGVSKEHRLTPIVQMGLLLDTDGIPYNYEIFPGNQNDMTTMLPVMKKARIRQDESRVVMVADKGLNTSNNIAAIICDGNGFIISQSVRKATKTLQAWVLDDKGYEKNESETFKIKSRISEKKVVVAGFDGKDKTEKVTVKEIAFWSRDFFERARYERARVIEKSSAAIERGDASTWATRSSVKYAKDVPFVKDTGEVAEHNWILDTEKIDADAVLDGYYCIITSEVEMADRDVIDAYRGLWRIEESFRILKSDFDARPVFVSREDHIRAHFLICYIALFIMRLMQKDTKWACIDKAKCGFSAKEISNALSQVVGHNLDSNLWYFDYRSDLTDALAKAVGVDLSRQVLRKSDVTKIMAETRKK